MILFPPTGDGAQAHHRHVKKYGVDRLPISANHTLIGQPTDELRQTNAGRFGYPERKTSPRIHASYRRDDQPGCRTTVGIGRARKMLPVGSHMRNMIEAHPIKFFW